MSLVHSRLVTHETFWTAVVAVLLALLITAWVYGIFCYVQMVRHRRSGVPAFSMLWPAEFLTEKGLQYRRRALRSYVAFGILALLLVLVNLLLPAGGSG
jgi:predicted DNA repair protein MutK